MSWPSLGVASVMVLATIVPLAVSQDTETYPNACRDVSADDAVARAAGVALSINGVPLLNGTLISNVSAEQRGPGNKHAGDDYMQVNVLHPLVNATILRSRVDLEVEADPIEAQAWADTRVVDLNILDGLVTAEVVRGWAYAEADVRHADTDSHHSTIVGLKVDGVPIVDVSPGLRVDLPHGLFGNGSYVEVHQRVDTSTWPGHNGTGPNFVANLTVTMLRVHLEQESILSLMGTPVDINVSQSFAYASSPTPWCDGFQSVDADAYVARVRPDGMDGTQVLLGHQDINMTGGFGDQQILGIGLLENQTLLRSNTSETKVYGDVNLGVDSRARAVAQVHGTCLLLDSNSTSDFNETNCLVWATLLRAESNSYANGTAAMSWGSTTIVDLVVAGVSVCDMLGMNDTCRPAPNTRLAIGPIVVILNEQEWTTGLDGHTELTVRALRLESPDLGIVIVSRAHTAADFVVFSEQSGP